MNDYILMMHDDAEPHDAAAWPPYLARLRGSGRFDGGSSIGGGVRISKGAGRIAVSGTLTGYLRVRAESLEDAARFVEGNPVYEAGGTIELRELPRD